MLFSEVYGDYYACVADILEEAQAGTLTRERIGEIVREKGFSESVLVIPRKLSGGDWPLLTKDLRTPVRHAPVQPVTLLQKRWLKALLCDPRIRLFDVTDAGLEDVRPLFDPDKVVWFDRYADGDPFGDPGYIARFRLLLAAVKTHRLAEVSFVSHRGKANTWTVFPYRLEYSREDDKFRLLCFSRKGLFQTLNLARITACRLRETFDPADCPAPAFPSGSAVLELTDERNALERAMLEFSYLAKRTERLGEKTYRLTLRYREEDETELLIRILSFGPLLKILEPERLAGQARERIEKQIALCGLD